MHFDSIKDKSKALMINQDEVIEKLMKEYRGSV